MSTIPFHVPDLDDRERDAVLLALTSGQLGGDGELGRRAETRLAELTGADHVLLVTSATHALELALLTLGVGPGDEVLVPSFAYPSNANSILLRGATPVFVDVSEDTLDLDPDDAASVVTERTVAVMPIDYGGVGCDVLGLKAQLGAVAGRDIAVVQDSAHGFLSRRDGQHLGTAADFGVLSFHVTKNIVSGEGGALFIQDDALAARAEVIREKGTNRAAFLRGEVPFYEWVAMGSSYGLSDLLASILLVQLDKAEALTARRRAIVTRYDAELADVFERGLLRPQVIPDNCEANGHLYPLRTDDPASCKALRAHLAEAGVTAPFHFVPLHSAAYAREHLGARRNLPVTDRVWNTLLRLPVYPSLTDADQGRVIAATRSGVGL